MNSKIRLFEEPETLRVGLEKTRKQILDLLRVKNMTISQISKALEKDQSTVYRHVKKLEEAGFIEVKGERKEHHIPERIYGRTADVFLMSPEPISSENTPTLGIRWDQKTVEECLELIEELEYEVEKDGKINEMCHIFQELDADINEEIIEGLEENKDVDFFSIIQTKFIIALLKMINDHPQAEKIEEFLSNFEEKE